jgi:hypothetical protein
MGGVRLSGLPGTVTPGGIGSRRDCQRAPGGQSREELGSEAGELGHAREQAGLMVDRLHRRTGLQALQSTH